MSMNRRHEDKKERRVFYQNSSFKTITKREQRKFYFQKQIDDTETETTHNRKQQANKVGEHNTGLRVATAGRAQFGLTKTETDATKKYSNQHARYNDQKGVEEEKWTKEQNKREKKRRKQLRYRNNKKAKRLIKRRQTKMIKIEKKDFSYQRINKRRI